MNGTSEELNLIESFFSECFRLCLSLVSFEILSLCHLCSQDDMGGSK